MNRSQRLTQRGSLASYTSIVLAVVVVLAGGSLLFTVHWPASIRPWGPPAAGTDRGMIVAAVLAATSRGRLRALLRISRCIWLICPALGAAVVLVP